MNIEQIITHPITTPEFSDPEEARRFIHDQYNVYATITCFSKTPPGTPSVISQSITTARSTSSAAISI
jgi:hypothetical protein